MPAAQSASHGKRTSTTKRGLHPLRWIKKFFSRPLKIRRIGSQWHVVFDLSRMEAPSTTSKPGRGEALRLAHLALQALLVEHREARHVLPHLVHLEQALGRNGSRALTDLPVKVLQRAMDQLETIATGAHAEVLLPLRMRVEESVRLRTPVNLRGDIANVEVTDASASLYDEVEDHFTNRMELDDIYARAGASAEPATTK
jgi:hypothetical protein